MPDDQPVHPDHDADAELKQRQREWRWWQLRPMRGSGHFLEPVCDDCGYSLRGLPARGACPECGNPFDLALRTGVCEADERIRPNTWRRLKIAFWVTCGVISLGTVFGGLLACLGPGPMLLAMFVAGMTLLLWWALTGQFDIDVRWKREEEEQDG